MTVAGRVLGLGGFFIAWFSQYLVLGNLSVHLSVCLSAIVSVLRRPDVADRVLTFIY